VKVLIVAGGTGGHLYPGVAVRATLKDERRLCRASGDLGRDIWRRKDCLWKKLPVRVCPETSLSGCFQFPYRFLKGWLEARRLLKNLRPDGSWRWVDICPSRGLNARILGIRILIHEQNVLPGLANRLLSVGRTR